MDAVQVEDAARRGRWMVVASGTLALGASLAALLWWDAQGFDPGDTRDVTAQVQECGHVRVDAVGEEWRSEEPWVFSGDDGATESGVLERTSTNQATYTSDVDGVHVPMQRIRSDYFWILGCSIDPTL